MTVIQTKGGTALDVKGWGQGPPRAAVLGA